ncbi:hypothetical protein [Enterovibrio norvegicus]|uniref:hypothetical protein n=1 Tax=Enterovibrio norvegicus TaxID=188144 RepID=UPI0024B1CA42|nr:hypothetical protein [Enterovibrio norvegicus]
MNRFQTLFPVSLLISLTLFGGGPLHAQSYPNAGETKANLEMLGYHNEWQPTQEGEKQVINNGEIWVNKEDTFAHLAVVDDDEDAMLISIIDNLAICATLGVAVSGQRSDQLFEIYGGLISNALSAPKKQIVDDVSAFRFHLTLIVGAEQTTLLHCGVKAIHASTSSP